jgi:hypothetical protein
VLGLAVAGALALLTAMWGGLLWVWADTLK